MGLHPVIWPNKLTERLLLVSCIDFGILSLKVPPQVLEAMEQHLALLEKKKKGG